jgi:hypothetical protein
MIWMKALVEWWKSRRKDRGERLCADNRHAWGDDMTASQAFPERTAIEHLLNGTNYYSYVRCRRCNALGRRLRTG